jgi:molybdate transport system regulatory protein
VPWEAIIIFFTGSVMQNKHNGLEVRSKLWIEAGGEPVFGKGRRILLEAIRTYGSINQAAKEINISYRKAWSYIAVMEERLGIRLIERQVGGRNGGGASLTAEAKMFLRQYGELERDIEGVVNERFRRIFRRNGL